MAKIEYGGGVTAMNGSLGGSVFQRNGAGFCIRSKGACKKSRTIAQGDHLSEFQFLRKQWLDLNLTQRQEWNQYAVDHTRTDRWGTTKQVNGIAWFSSINWFRQLAGESLFTSPPTYAVPDAVPTWSFDYDNTTMWVNIDHDDFSDDHAVIISASDVGLYGSYNRRAAMRFMKFFAWRLDDVYEFTDEWESIFSKLWSDSHPAGVQIIVQVQLMWVPTGIVGPVSSSVYEIS